MKRRGDVPGQKFFDAVDWMLGDRCQDRAQIELRIEAVQFGCSDEAVHGGSTLSAAIGAGE